MTTRKAYDEDMMTRKIVVDWMGVILALAAVLFVAGFLSGMAIMDQNRQAEIVCQEEDDIQFHREEGVLMASCLE